SPGLDAFALKKINDNLILAKQKSLPVCQDTGTLTFYVKTPVSSNKLALRHAIYNAIVSATEAGYLRQNSVNTLTGENNENNIGLGHPVIHFEQWAQKSYEVRLIMKGGGCENMSRQYQLPAEIGGRQWNRDLEGVKTCLLDAVNQAQGKGCAPGFLGVGLGGDRASGYELAKRQLLRPMQDKNLIPELAELEEIIVEQANSLNIGPMGFGGKFTLGACKIGTQNRLPASYFISIAYMCWAFRRRGVILDPKGKIDQWLYQLPSEFKTQPLKVVVADKKDVDKMAKVLKTPLTEASVTKLSVGDTILLSGTIFTARDAVHQYLHNGGKLPQIQNSVIYHCGPVVLETESGYVIKAAGPTTSIREEPYMADIIKKQGLKAIIGKGGMGKKTLAALKENGAVYLHAIGGAAQIYASCIKTVKNVYLKNEFGSPEAVWELEVENFPAIVTMDAAGNSLHEMVLTESEKNLKKLLEK
ncbi:fumarate hydratase, partial [bacterium]|nr:fumarate hydratase [bacterium]